MSKRLACNRIKKMSISRGEEAASTRNVKKQCEIQTKCPDLKGECGGYHEFFDQVSSTIFYRDVEWIHVWQQFRVCSRSTD